MTQIQPFPTGLFPAIAMALAEGDALPADPAAFLALAGEGTTDPQGEAEVAGAMAPLPVAGWPLSPPAVTVASTAPFAAIPEEQAQIAPEAVPGAAVAPRWPVGAGIELPYPSEMTAPGQEIAVDRLPEAKASDSPAPVPLVVPVVASVPLAAAVVPVQAGTGIKTEIKTEATAATAPVTLEGAMQAAVPADAAIPPGPPDRVAQKQPDHRPVPPSAPVTVTAESAKAVFASPVDTKVVEPQVQEAPLIPATSGPQDPILAERTIAPATQAAPAGMQETPPVPMVSATQVSIPVEQRAALAMQAAPADLPAPPEMPTPSASAPDEPVAAATVVTVDKAPAADRVAERAEGRMVEGQTTVAASPEIWIADRSTPPSPQPAMAREERLWRSLWPTAEARSATPVAAAATAVPAAEKRAVAPDMPAVADAPVLADAPVGAEPEDKATDGPEAASSAAKPESAAAVPDRAGPALPGPAGTTPAPLPGTVVPMGGAVPHILHPTRALPADPVQAPPPAPPVQVQIVQALSSGGGAVTELRLSPEELGHVRIDMRQEGDRLVMVVSAERQDTLDLLRRHAGELASDLRSAGHSGLDLSFGQWTGPGAEADGQPDGMPEAEMPWSEMPQDAARAVFRPQPHQPVGGLYLRI